MRYRKRRYYPGNGPFRDLPQYQRPGFQYRDRGGGCWGTDPARCARFPWLSRWWWADTDSDTPFVPGSVPSSEKESLESQTSYLKNELDKINKRLEEFDKTEGE